MYARARALCAQHFPQHAVIQIESIHLNDIIQVNPYVWYICIWGSPWAMAWPGLYTAELKIGSEAGSPFTDNDVAPYIVGFYL